MDEFMKKIWDMCKDRFGQATDVDIHVDAQGVTVHTSSRAFNENEDDIRRLTPRRIDGEQLKRI